MNIGNNIRKYREQNNIDKWTVPYLPIDPNDIGRVYETDVIRINSQSGKGGLSYILEHNFNYKLPKDLSEELSYLIKSISANNNNELSPKEILDIFTKNYINVFDRLKINNMHFSSKNNNSKVNIEINFDNKNFEIESIARGKFESVTKGIMNNFDKFIFNDLTYDEHAITKGADSSAITYLSYKNKDGKKIWGVGIDHDILTSSIYALFSAMNRELKE